MLSEKKLVVVLFIMVLVTFYFAQADSSKMEKMYLNYPRVTTSLEQTQKPEGEAKAKELKPVILQFR